MTRQDIIDRLRNDDEFYTVVRRAHWEIHKSADTAHDKKGGLGWYRIYNFAPEYKNLIQRGGWEFNLYLNNFDVYWPYEKWITEPRYVMSADAPER